MFWKVALEQSAMALNTVPDKHGETPFMKTLGEPSWLIPMAFGCLVWVRRNKRLNELASKLDMGRLYPALFLAWVVLPGTAPQRDIVVIPWMTLKSALVSGTWKGWKRLRRVRDYYRASVLQFPVAELEKAMSIRNESYENEDAFHLDDVMDENSVILDDVEEDDENHNLDVHLSPPVSENDHTTHVRERSAREDWLDSCLPDPPPLNSKDGTGTARQDFTDGPMVVVPPRSRRPPWIGTLVWPSLYMDVREREVRRWHSWVREEPRITIRETLRRMATDGLAKERDVAVA
eukprot:6492499-Amphidinium_carterae.1